MALLAEQARGDWLLLHDVARPFASVGLLQRVIEAARATDCAGAFVDPEVPVARLRDGFAVVGAVTALVIVYLIVNLIVDLLYGVLDPRISHD